MNLFLNYLKIKVSLEESLEILYNINKLKRYLIYILIS